MIYYLGTFYNNAYVCIERNGIGEAVLKFLTEIYEYDNVICVGGQNYGFYSTHKTKEDACLFFKTFLEKNEIVFRESKEVA